MKNDYLKVLKDNNLKYMYHFTNIRNLESIIENGLCNRAYMDSNNIRYSYTDINRFDNQTNCISLSINTTNKNMLYSKSNKNNNDWIVFEFDAEEIINDFYNKIYYCKYNASSSTVVKMLKENKKYLKSVIAFENMFKKHDGYLQGELLLEDNINFKYIKNIYVLSLQVKMITLEILNEKGINNVNVIIKKELF